MALLFIPLDEGFAWRFVKGDCYTHGAWLWNRLKKHRLPVDVLFVGSSRTIHAVYEKAIEDSLSVDYDNKMHLLNAGYCRFGNNLPYLVAKEAMEWKHPATIVWEVRETEDCCSHPMFGYLAPGAEVRIPAVFPHRRIFSDWWNAAAVRVEYGQSLLFGDENANMAADTGAYGYGADAGTADPALLANVRTKKNQGARNTAQETFPADFPRTYLEKTLALARAKNIRFVFLYIPEYGSEGNLPEMLSYYRSLGPVWLPPRNVFDDPAHWMDATHLNDRGASVLAGWLAGQLNALK